MKAGLIIDTSPAPPVTKAFTLHIQCQSEHPLILKRVQFDIIIKPGRMERKWKHFLSVRSCRWFMFRVPANPTTIRAALQTPIIGRHPRIYENRNLERHLPRSCLLYPPRQSQFNPIREKLNEGTNRISPGEVRSPSAKTQRRQDSRSHSTGLELGKH